MARIRIGLEKYGPQFMMDAIHTARDAGQSMVFPFTNPMRTQMSQVTHGVIVGLSHSGTDADRSRPTSEPLMTQTSCQEAALITNLYWSGETRSTDEPLTTQTARQDKALIVPYYNTGVAGPVNEALPTVTAVDRHALLTTPQDFILGYYTRNSGQQAALSGSNEAMPTQSSQPRHYLVHPEIDIMECGFRMLKSVEVGNAMAFERTYVVKGTEREKVKQYGLAVTPPAMELLVSRGVESLK
jgi:DNA (cytosine-5)-methyltransferase 1